MASKTTARKPAAARKAAAGKPAAQAAAAEKSGEPRSITWRGLNLTLPATLPGTLYFDLAALEDESASLAAQMRLLTGLIGDDQLRQVRDKVAADGIGFDEVADAIVELMDDVLGAYGLDQGEADASPGS